LGTLPSSKQQWPAAKRGFKMATDTDYDFEDDFVEIDDYALDGFLGDDIIPL